MVKRSSTRCDTKKIKKIRAKISKKNEYSSRSVSRSDSDSSLPSDRKWYEIIQPDEIKDMNKLYHVVTNNINNKNQCDDAIKYELDFDNKLILFSGTNGNLMQVVTVRLIVGKKHREMIIYSLPYLWDIGATTSTVKRQYNKPYKRKMNSNKAE